MTTEQRRDQMGLNIILGVCILTAAVGCAPQAKQLQQIKLGMQKSEVIQELGDPQVVRGSIRNKSNQIIEVWEYRLQFPEDAGKKIGLTVFTMGMYGFIDTHPYKNYWLYFVEDILEKWGEAGDWQIEQKNIYEMRFGKGVGLSTP